MGTHPIFESDFDCLTECLEWLNVPTTSFFRRTLDPTKRFVVDFTATWCGPCRTMAPIFDQLSMKHTFITFLKIDIDKCPNTAAKFGIRSVPSFLFLEGTKQLDSMGGVDPEQLDRKCPNMESQSREKQSFTKSFARWRSSFSEA